MKKLMTMMAVGMMVLWAEAGEVTATAVTAQQRYPWNGLVDITVTLSGASNDAAQVAITFVATNSATHSALDVSHVIGNSVVSGNGSTWTRQFVWDAAADLGEVTIADVELAVEAKPLGGVQLWENGPYWAECNVGATKPEECGYYFWWGDTVGYSANTNSATWTDDTDGGRWDGVTWVSSNGDVMNGSPFRASTCPTCYKTTAQLQSEGYIDSTFNLVAAHDAATAHLGIPWRMPTDADFRDLVNKCDTTWETCNGVWGWRMTGRGAYSSKSIFLPAVGHGNSSGLRHLGQYGCYGLYWSTSGAYLDFDSDYCGLGFGIGRYCGLSVRPVRDVAQ